MSIRFVYQRYQPIQPYKPLFYQCMTSGRGTAELAWYWTVFSTPFTKGESEVRTSYRKLAGLAYCHHETVRKKLEMLQEADLAIVDEFSSKTSFRLRLRVGPGGPIFEEGSAFQSGGWLYLRVPQYWIYFRPDLIPEAKVLWGWSMGGHSAEGDWEPLIERTSTLRKLFDFSRYKERKAMDQLISEELMALADTKNSMELYGGCPLACRQGFGGTIDPSELVFERKEDVGGDYAPVKDRKRLCAMGSGSLRD